MCGKYGRRRMVLPFVLPDRSIEHFFFQTAQLQCCSLGNCPERLCGSAPGILPARDGWMKMRREKMGGR